MVWYWVELKVGDGELGMFGEWEEEGCGSKEKEQVI